GPFGAGQFSFGFERVAVLELNSYRSVSHRRGSVSTKMERPSTGERRTLTGIFIGPPRDVKDPAVFHTMSLVAFLAWVGLGSDGLSSSCYGPEEAFIRAWTTSVPGDFSCHADGADGVHHLRFV